MRQCRDDSRPIVQISDPSSSPTSGRQPGPSEPGLTLYASLRCIKPTRWTPVDPERLLALKSGVQLRAQRELARALAEADVDQLRLVGRADDRLAVEALDLEPLGQAAAADGVGQRLQRLGQPVAAPSPGSRSASRPLPDRSTYRTGSASSVTT